MKKLFKTMLLVKIIIIMLFIPNLTTSLEKDFNPMDYIADVTIKPLNNIRTGASGAIADTIIIEEVKVYSTSIIRVRREPNNNQSNIVGLIPANAEMTVIENVDDIWSKVKINNKEYFVCKKYITTATPKEVVTILNIEPTHQGVYFVNSDGKAVDNPNYINLGTYKLTGYCACINCCGKDNGITATGTKATQGRTIAVDPRNIPYGTTVIIDGHPYVAEDCGGAIKGNIIDVYFEDHSIALEFGVQYTEVFTWKY